MTMYSFFCRNVSCPDPSGAPPNGSGPPPGAGPGGMGGAPPSEPEPEGESGAGMNIANWFYLLAFASLLRGFGSSPAFVLGPTYLDENVSQKKSPRLLG